MLVACREVGGVRSPVAHGHSEALCAANHDVGAKFARRLDQRERQEIGGNDKESLHGVDPPGQIRIILDGAVGCRVLDQGAEKRIVQGLLAPRSRYDLPTQRLGARAQERNGLRVDVIRHEELVTRPLGAVRHGHGLRRRGGFVEQRSVGNLHPA